MKWFKHDCDMHTNLKIQELIDREKTEGYAIWCLCLEFVGKEGKKGKLDGRKRWKKGLLKVLQWPDKERLERILNVLAELRLINPKSLGYGNLHIPEFHKRADDWTRRQLRSEFGVSSEKLPHRIDKIKKEDIDKIREEYIKLKDWLEEDLISSDYARINKRIKDLLIKAKGNVDKVTKAIRWINTRGYDDWTLETVIKKWGDFIKREKRQEAQIERNTEAHHKLEKMRKEAEQEKPIDPDALKELTDKIGEI